MSKMDGLRAMREARYAEAAAKAKPSATKKAAPAKAAPTKVAAPPESVASEDAADVALCGHRNMSGRTCTREHGHAAKSHRYS